MTISSTSRKSGPYSCNGSTTQFPFDFKVFAAADVLAVLTDPSGLETTLTSGYTVSLNANQDSNPGGTITTTSTYATGYLVTLTSAVQNLQSVDLTNQGGFYPKVLNTALDRLTVMVQQVAEQVSRAVKTSISSSSTPDQLLSDIGAAVTNATNSATAAAGSATNSANSATAAAGSATAAANSATAAQAAVGSVLVDASDTTAGRLSSKLVAGSGITFTVQSPGGNESLRIDGQQPGEICYFARNTAPTGFLKANGAAVSRTTYAALFAAIGTTFGVGDGSTTFNIPDLRGEFLRGWDDSRGVDSGRVFGSAQAGTDHVNLNTNSTPTIIGNSSVTATNVDAWGANANRSYVTGGMTTDATQNAQTYKSRPRNIALLACIKY